MKYFTFITTLTFFSMNVFAQKQTFDVVSYSIPAKWQKVQNEGGVQLSVSDKKTGAYALAIITKATASDAPANENFSTDWSRLVKAAVQVDDGPTMLAPTTENGWDIVSGNANYTDGGKKGKATLLTATGGGKMVSVVLMTNTQNYQDELLAFLNSLELAKIERHEKVNTGQPDKSSVVGLWCDYVLETTGYSINGMQQYTAGYLRKEYSFYPDGTYLFRNKQWLTKAPDITFIYETGTYSVQHNQIILTPKNGKAGFWGKTASSKEWGPPKKTSDYKLEKTTYTFEILIDPTYGNSIVLKPTNPTQRSGGQFNAANDPYEFHYRFRSLESLIDNPPGVKTGFENKPIVAITTVSSDPTQPKNDNASDVTKLWGIWGQYTSESNTAGYDWREYYFNNDGTYQFLEKSISYLYHNDIIFIYEKGTYKLNGNQLTISPQSGTVESWSKAGSDKAGKLLKTEKRILENVTYTIDFHYFSGIKETNLVLQYNRQTVRDGAWSSNNSYKNSWLYKRPFSPDKLSIELPAGTKIDFKYKPLTAGITSTKNNEPVAAVISPLTGKIWEGTTTEKFSNAGGTSYNTGGFATNQYQFNADGTYRFVSVTASHYTETKTLNYETGTYTINGNQLTISPSKGYNEEWSKISKTSNGNSDVSNRAINETWGKKLKSSGRKLEQVTYTFSTGKNGERTALILQYGNGHTEREGNGNQTYLNETAAANSVRLPAGMK